jgi:hypothetical protein
MAFYLSEFGKKVSNGTSDDASATDDNFFVWHFQKVEKHRSLGFQDPKLFQVAHVRFD